MNGNVRICPRCRQELTNADYVASKYPNGYKRGIDKCVENPLAEPGDRFRYTWVYVGNTYSNTHFFRCGQCGANVKVETFERVTEV